MAFNYVFLLFYTVGWGSNQVAGFGEEPGIKQQFLNLVRSVRTVMRSMCHSSFITVDASMFALYCYLSAPSSPLRLILECYLANNCNASTTSSARACTFVYLPQP